MGHAPPRAPKYSHQPPPRGRPNRLSPTRGYYSPGDPPETGQREFASQRHRRSYLERKAIATAFVAFAAALVFSTQTSAAPGLVAFLGVLGVAAALIGGIAEEQRRAAPAIARWADDPPLEVPGVSEVDVRTYHGAAVRDLMEDVTTPAEFEDALDRLWHDSEAALAAFRPRTGSLLSEEEIQREIADDVVVHARRGYAETILAMVKTGALRLSPDEMRAMVGFPEYAPERSPVPRPEPDRLERAR